MDKIFKDKKKSVEKRIEKFSIMNNWIGAWEGNYSVGDKSLKETLTNTWVHNINFFQMEIRGGSVDYGGYKYTSTTMLTIDNNGNVVGWWFDDFGFDGVMKIKGKFEDEKLILEGSGNLWTYNETWEIKDGKLYRTNHLKEKEGGKESSNETVFLKKQ